MSKNLTPNEKNEELEAELKEIKDLISKKITLTHQIKAVTINLVAAFFKIAYFNNCIYHLLIIVDHSHKNHLFFRVNLFSAVPFQSIKFISQLGSLLKPLSPLNPDMIFNKQDNLNLNQIYPHSNLIPKISIPIKD